MSCSRVLPAAASEDAAPITWRMVKPGRHGIEAASGDAAPPEGSKETPAAPQAAQLVAEARGLDTATANWLAARPQPRNFSLSSSVWPAASKS